MKPIAFLVAVVMFLNVLTAAVRGDHAEYIGGTANIPKEARED